MIKNSTVSKDVGWDARYAPIPTRAVAETTIGSARRGMYGSVYNLLEWHRFAPSPKNDEERDIMNMITVAYKEATE